MANRKLKNFEFANHCEKGTTHGNTDELTFFDCVNGSVFLLCQDSRDYDLDVRPAGLATQRMKYYLENEFVNSPSAALRNALIYTNGFIFEYGRKNPDYKDAFVHCAAILIRHNEVFYATIGEPSMYFFNGKRPVLIARGNEESDHTDADGEQGRKEEGNDVHVPLLGRYRDIHPQVNAEALVPLNGDMLLMCSRGFYDNVSEKSMLKILADPMPVQTKVYRFVDLASIASGDENISLQLISFYNLTHKERKYVALPSKKSKVLKKKEPLKAKAADKTEKESRLEQYRDRLKDSPARYILVGIAVLLIAYMFYDLFIHDPRPPVRQSADKEAVAENVSEGEVLPPKEQETAETSHAVIPEDAVYTVKNGDTWSRIYSQYGVCSWFVKNHPLNAGKFDNEENPVEGTQIYIPLLYSAKEEHNPDFYQEFSLQKTGSRCQNANQEFIDKFEAEYL